MNHYLSAAIMLLAIYAQATSADQNDFVVLSQQQNLAFSEIRSVSPALSIVQTKDGGQLVGFANFSRIVDTSSATTHHNQGIGIAYLQQHSSWLQSQLRVQQHPIMPNRVQSLMEWMVGF